MPDKENAKTKKEIIEQLTAEVADLTAQLAEARAEAEKEPDNAMLRLQADFDNYRKRTAEQSRRQREDGIAEAITKFIPVLDVVNQALQMITDEKVAEGVRMIYNQMTESLTALGVTEIPALGTAFDPMLHNAVLQVNVSNPDQVGQVVEVFQKGYQMGDKILRYSVVKVGC